MKKSLVASGFMGIVASLLGVMAVGCGAATDEQGAEAEIGSTSQAIALSITESGNYDVKFPGFIQTGANTVLVVGGYDPATGNGLRKIRVATYDSTVTPKTVTWSSLLDVNSAEIQLPVNKGRGEPEVTKIATDKYLISGGRDVDPFKGASSVFSDAYLLDLTGTPALSAAITMTAAHVNHKVIPCGTGASKFLVIAGDNGSASTKVLEVYTPGSPGSFATMKNKLSPFSDITLTDDREFHEAQALDATHVMVFGGETSGGTRRSSTELLTVDSSCNLDVGNSATVHPAAGAAMPAARSRFASLKLASTITLGGIAYDVIAAGGDEGGTAPLTTYLYDIGTDAWTSSGTPSLAAGDGHVRPIFADDGAGNFVLAGGLKAHPSGTHPDLTTAKVDTFNGTSFSGSTMTDDRYAGWTGFIGTTATWIVAQGVDRTFSSPNYVESAMSNAE